jgi:Na+-transporting NADH:ubiquinone oxidoreductase subunit C
MKKDGFFAERIFPVLFMLVITVVCIAVVSSIHLSTKELVELNETLFLKEAVLFAANVPAGETPAEIITAYEERISEVLDDEGSIKYFQILGESGNEASGYVVFQDGAGLWGRIEAVVGYESDLETLTGVDFIRQNETPGLGARIMEVWFREQFRGKTGPFTMVPEGTVNATDQFDAITGATRTSMAVLKMMNTSVANVTSIVGE